MNTRYNVVTYTPLKYDKTNKPLRLPEGCEIRYVTTPGGSLMDDLFELWRVDSGGEQRFLFGTATLEEMLVVVEGLKRLQLL